MANNNTWDQLLGITQAKLAGSAPVERRKLALGQLSPNADQPRKFFESRALTDLVASVKQHGILQPIVVRPHPADAGRFQIVAGERRWLAAQQAGLVEVPVVVRELDDQQALEIGLVENVLREDITPLEEARALQRLIDAFGYSYAKLGERLGKNKAYVDHRVRLLKMPAELQDALDRGVAEGEEARVRRPFTPRHAGVVVQVEDPAARAALIEAVFAEGLSVQQLQERARPRPAAADGQLAGGASMGTMAPGTAAPEVVAAGATPAAAPGEAPVLTTTVPMADPEPPARPKRVRDAQVPCDTLAVFGVLEAARKGKGKASARALLAAMEADRQALKALLHEG